MPSENANLEKTPNVTLYLYSRHEFNHALAAIELLKRVPAAAVLAVGGLTLNNLLLTSAEVWDNGEWTETGLIKDGRYNAEMATSNDGTGEPFLKLDKDWKDFWISAVLSIQS